MTEVPLERLFTAYRIGAADGVLPEGGNMDDYMIGLWFQEDTDGNL